jgi:formylglycine-generating enzyme required for sulfatase activity
LELYDLSGNVWEWCRNRYDKPESDMDPTKVDMSRTSRVLRGGSWAHNRDFARAAYRYNYIYASVLYGFRVVVVVRPPSHHPDH